MYQYRVATFDDIRRITEIELRAQTESLPSLPERNAIEYEARCDWWINYFIRAGNLQETVIRRPISSRG